MLMSTNLKCLINGITKDTKMSLTQRTATIASETTERIITSQSTAERMITQSEIEIKVVETRITDNSRDPRAHVGTNAEIPTTTTIEGTGALQTTTRALEDTIRKMIITIPNAEILIRTIGTTMTESPQSDRTDS